MSCGCAVQTNSCFKREKPLPAFTRHAPAYEVLPAQVAFPPLWCRLSTRVQHDRQSCHTTRTPHTTAASTGDCPMQSGTVNAAAANSMTVRCGVVNLPEATFLGLTPVLMVAPPPCRVRWQRNSRFAGRDRTVNTMALWNPDLLRPLPVRAVAAVTPSFAGAPAAQLQRHQLGHRPDHACQQPHRCPQRTPRARRSPAAHPALRATTASPAGQRLPASDAPAAHRARCSQSVRSAVLP